MCVKTRFDTTHVQDLDDLCSEGSRAVAVHVHNLLGKQVELSVQAMKAYRESRGIDPLIPNLGAGGR